MAGAPAGLGWMSRDRSAFHRHSLQLRGWLAELVLWTFHQAYVWAASTIINRSLFPVVFQGGPGVNKGWGVGGAGGIPDPWAGWKHCPCKLSRRCSRLWSCHGKVLSNLFLLNRTFLWRKHLAFHPCLCLAANPPQHQRIVGDSEVDLPHWQIRSWEAERNRHARVDCTAPGKV